MIDLKDWGGYLQKTVLFCYVGWREAAVNRTINPTRLAVFTTASRFTVVMPAVMIVIVPILFYSGVASLDAGFYQMSTLFGLFIIATIAALWIDNLRAREIAISASLHGCQQRGVQLLDQTVAIASTRPVWSRGKLRLRRIYRFDYSDEGLERYSGSVVLIGRHVVDFSLGIEEDSRL